VVDGARPHDPSKPSVLIRLPRRTEMLVLPERSLEISNPPDCLRQLIFESDWEEFPYWMMGTGFLALWNNSIFLITAAHCIAENQHNALRIPIRPHDAQILPFDKFMTFETPSDARDLDVAMYRAKPPTEQDLFDVRNAAAPISPVHSFDSVLAQVQAASANEAALALFAFGFPRAAEASKVDLIASHITSQPAEVHIQYLRPSSEPHRHIGKILRTTIGDLNGMSGSPVFLRTTRTNESPRRYMLAGMLVRASASTVEFVSGHLLSNALGYASHYLRA
jgi:hypothetical protein